MTKASLAIVTKNLDEACIGLLDKLLEPRHELVTLIEGDGARP